MTARRTFLPLQQEKKSTESVVLDLEFEAVTILLCDLRNEKKATAEYISILDESFSFLNTSD